MTPRMSHARDTAVLRDPDEDGFHRLPISSCCRTAVAYYRKDVHMFVRAWDEHIGTEAIRCAKCNSPLA